MTREDALSILRDAPHSARPCAIDPDISQGEAVGKITLAVRSFAPGANLDAFWERRVWQVTRNQRHPIYQLEPEATHA
jgi:hypothetical protein